MRFRAIFSKGSFVLFNLITISYFIRGFLQPIETNYWLVHYGVPILMMEFLSVFVLFLIPGIRKRKSKTFVGLGIVVLFALAVSVIFSNYGVFLFFILTVLSKAILINTENPEKEIVLMGSILIAFLLSAILALLFSNLGNNFSDQQDLLRDKIIDSATKSGGYIGGEIVEHPAFVAIWGILYYILFTAFQSFELIKLSKTEKKTKEMDSDDSLKALR